jgi:transposase InsO family protein
MLTLWVMVEYLRTCIQCIVQHWRDKREQLYCRRKAIRAIDKHKHHYSQHKPEWLKQEIIRIKARMPHAGCRTIADICNRRFAASRKVTVGKTYVHQVLQRHDYEIQIARRNFKHAIPKSVQRNLIWGIDLTGKTDINSKLHALFAILDHGSRALLHLQALHDKTSRTLIACINEVINTHGKPRIIRTDNEAIFTSRIFRRGLKLLGIRHQLTDPGCPWQNGRIERLFGTLKEKLDQWIVSGIEQLNVDLTAFVHWYNHIRPHQNLEGRTPAEAWNGIDPYTKPPKQEHWFEAWDGLLTGYHLRY